MANYIKIGDVFIEYSSDSYLKHYGIPGQKWGIKHGPPYPLNYNAQDKTMKKLYEIYTTDPEWIRGKNYSL